MRGNTGGDQFGHSSHGRQNGNESGQSTRNQGSQAVHNRRHRTKPHAEEEEMIVFNFTLATFLFGVGIGNVHEDHPLIGTAMFGLAAASVGLGIHDVLQLIG